MEEMTETLKKTQVRTALGTSRSYMSKSKIAKMTGLSSREVAKILDALLMANLIEKMYVGYDGYRSKR